MGRRIRAAERLLLSLRSLTMACADHVLVRLFSGLEAPRGSAMDEIPFGRYVLRDMIGHGGMGQVYKAYDALFDRTVALKLLPAQLAADHAFRERFRREAQSAGKLNEPHIVAIYDFGEHDGHPFLTMPLIEGTDVQTLLARHGPMQPARAVSIIEQSAAALDTAHASGLVHRDVKPSNILVTAKNFVYLIDFGIARAAADIGLTGTGATIGTSAYMAPERLESGRADARTDVYALACVLYECLTGDRPFPGDSLEQVMFAHISKPPPVPSQSRPGIPAALDDVIACGMAKNPAKRYKTAGDLAVGARAALQSIPPPTRRVATFPAPPPLLHAPTILEAPPRRPTPATQSGSPPPLKPSKNRVGPTSELRRPATPGGCRERTMAYWIVALTLSTYLVGLMFLVHRGGQQRYFDSLLVLDDPGICPDNRTDKRNLDRSDWSTRRPLIAIVNCGCSILCASIVLVPVRRSNGSI